MKRIYLLIVLFFVIGEVSAQTYLGEASVPVAEADGFYRILITAQLSTFLNTDFTNVRILDKQNKEVPYLFQEESPIRYSEQFKSYEILEKTQQKNCCTTILLHNPGGQPINNISLSIKNAEVTKQATLLGSDDKLNWFALKQHFLLSSFNSTVQTSEIKIVDFPLSNYAYYQIQIEDSTSAPLNILNAGYYEVNSENGKYNPIPLHFNQADSASQKETFISILFDSAQVLDKLELTMTGAPYFLRRAELYQKKQRVNLKGKKETYFDFLYPFEISSKQSSVLDLSKTKAKEFRIVISNQDNPSLNVAGLKAYQLNRYLTAWLKKGETYTLKIGSPDLAAPVYDIAFFTDKIPAMTTVLNTSPLVMYNQEKETASGTFFTSNIIIWIAVVAVVVVLGFMAMKMANEAGKEKDQPS